MKRLVVLLAAMAIGLPCAAQEPLSFMGNRLGMSLSDFKAANNQDHFWVNTGDPAKHRDKKKTKMLFTPACTDEIRGFPGDDGELPDGVVLCNPAPSEINTMYRSFADTTARRILYRFYEGRLFAIDIEIPALSFNNVRAAFIQKYGSPATTEPVSYQNGFGARWTGDDLSWEFSKTSYVVMIEGSANGPAQDGLSGAPSSIVIADSALGPPRQQPKPLDF